MVTRPEAKIPYYVVRERHGRRLSYWCPTRRMKEAGFVLVALGEDGPATWAAAVEWNRRWQEHRLSIRDALHVEQGKVEGAKRGFVYFVRAGDRIKIGFSSDPMRRIAELKTGMSAAITLVVAVPGTMVDERKLHARFSAYRTMGEWFAASAPVIRAMTRSVAFGRPIHDISDSTDLADRFTA